jgi:hypothetical protein
MNQPTRMILAAILFAIALIASSYFLRGQSIGDWVDAAIYIALGGWFTFEVTQGLNQRQCRPARHAG